MTDQVPMILDLSLAADLEMTTVCSQTHINLMEKLVSLARKK